MILDGHEGSSGATEKQRIMDRARAERRGHTPHGGPGGEGEGLPHRDRAGTETVKGEGREGGMPSRCLQFYWPGTCKFF